MGGSHFIIPIFVPHQGCPFDCVFCNQKKITGLVRELTAKEVEKQIEKYLCTMMHKEDSHIEIAFYGGSFTGISKSKQEELLSIALKWKQRDIVKDIRISTRPDYISFSTMEFLSNYGVSIIELGVQSMKNDVLLRSGRGHTAEDVVNAVATIKQFPVQIGLQMMIGLPGDNFEKNLETADAIITLKPDFIRIYPALVLRDTYLEKLYAKGEYKALTLENAVSIAKCLLLKFTKYHVPVIRMGLQPTEDILLGKEVITGPFHPSFKQLVEADIYKDALEFLFKKYHIQNEQTVELQGNKRCISYLAGHKKRNINFLKDKFKINKIRIIENDHLGKSKIKLIWQSDKAIIYDIHEYINNAI